MSKNVTYGIWGISRDYPAGNWVLDGSENIIHTDLLGVAKAYVKMLQATGMNVKVVIIGYDGTPMELS